MSNPGPPLGNREGPTEHISSSPNLDSAAAVQCGGESHPNTDLLADNEVLGAATFVADETLLHAQDHILDVLSATVDLFDLPALHGDA